MKKLVILMFLITSCENAKILVVFPSPLLSHQAVIKPLLRKLTEKHQVTIVSGTPSLLNETNLENITEICLNLFHFNHCNRTFTIGKGNAITENVNAFEEHIFLFDYLVRTREHLRKLLYQNNDTFELLILDANIRPLLVFSHVFKAPVILISSNGGTNLLYDTIGAQTHPSLYPTKLQQKINDLTTWERLVTCFEYFRWMYEWARLEKKGNEMLKKVLGSEIPTLSELASNVDMLFLNTHPIWDRYRPSPPGLIYLWGIHLTPKKLLPKEIENYLDSSENGVIYMSLGTNVKSCMLPKEWIGVFLRAFAELPYNVLLKWDEDEPGEKPDNVMIAKWFPQADLLRHSNIILFISQGGVQSTDEAINAGVPLVGLPLISDQWYQTEKYEELGIGVQLDPSELTVDNFKTAIEKVIHNHTNNIVNLRDLMEDQPGVTGVSRAVWWIEYTLRHRGASHLRAPAANISWSEYLQLEILILAIVWSCLFGVVVLTVGWYGVKLSKALFRPGSEKWKLE